MEPVRILIVDDHDRMRSRLGEMLTAHAGWEVCGEARDGFEGVARARELRPDVVLMDVSMPRMGGIEASRIIRQENPAARVVVISQNDEGVVAEHAKDARAHAYVTKANLWRELIPKLEKLIDAKEQGSEGEKESGESGPDDTAGVFLEDLTLLQKLAEREGGHLAAIVNSSDDAIVSKNLDGIITSWNASAERLFGYSPEEAIGQSIFLIIPPERRAEELTILEKLKRGERVDHFETVRRRKDGSLVDLSLTISPVKDSKGRIIGASKTARDITERKVAEAEKRKFVTLADRCPEFIGMCDTEMQVFYVNEAGRQLVGREAENLERLPDYFFPEDQAYVLHSLIPAVMREGQARVEIRLRHFVTGAAIWMIFNIFAIKDASGRPIGLGMFSQDITARKKAEGLMAKWAREQKALFQFASGLQRAQSVDEVCTAAIEALFAALRCDRASILLSDEADTMRFVCWRGLSDDYRNATDGHSPWNRTDASAAPICVSDVRQADIEERLKSTIEAEGIRALAFFPLMAEGELIGKIMTYYDAPHEFSEDEIELSQTIAQHLTGKIHLRRADEALRQSEERLRRLAERLDAEVKARTEELEARTADVLRQTEQLRELSWRIMHIQDEERRHIARELHDSAGQTLAVLAMNLAALLRRAREKSPEFAEQVAESESLVQGLNQEVRTMSYLLHPPLLDECGLAAALGWYVQGLTERSGLQIGLKIGEQFGRLPNNMELMVFRLVQECLTNIHRHSESKSALIRLRRDGERVIVEVQDKGRGIAAEKLAEIQSHGAGVGIRGMRERVRQFDGEMKVESNGTGTKVTVELRVPKTWTDAVAEGEKRAFAKGQDSA